MNNPLDPTLRELNDCGCFAGTDVQTPATVDNRPGLPAVHFRPGDHSQFKATLLAGLSSRRHPSLGGLRTREDDDPTLALLDAFACMADVLTFYSERMLNEAYLRTATERRSVLELGRAIGYELAPGVAAEAMLAFTVEGGEGTPGTAIIPKGTKVQSIPGPGEKPQVFETSTEFTARAEWNELRLQSRNAPLSGEGLLQANPLYLDGTAIHLKEGDILVLATGTTAQARRIAAVHPDHEQNHTRIDLQDPPATTPPRVSRGAIAAPAGTSALGGDHNSPGPNWTGAVVESVFAAGVTSLEVQRLADFLQWQTPEIQAHLNKLPKFILSTRDAGVFVMRARLGFFGHNAPRWGSLPKSGDTAHLYEHDWDDLNIPSDMKSDRPKRPTTIWQDSQGDDLALTNNNAFDVLLERSVPEVVKDSWLVLEAGELTRVFRVSAVSEISRADYALSAKCTGLRLQIADGRPMDKADADFLNRKTTAHVHSDPLTVIGAPITADLRAGEVEVWLEGLQMSLFPGQSLAIQGENADLSHTQQGEIAAIKAISFTAAATRLTLTEGLRFSYIRSTVTIAANVVPATHGETVQEVLGSGNATLPFQRFTLKQGPLTYVIPPAGSAVESSLEIWVDEVKWQEVPAFLGCGQKDRVYVVRHADEGTTTVEFGDGLHGARLPTGNENIRAVYRKGIGLPGLVKADRVKLLLMQPSGVKAVTNPQAAQGAEDPQSLADARDNVPCSVLTLDRVVSLQDYEDYARNCGGIAKAHAAWTWNGQTRGILLTLLGPNGAVIKDTGQPADRVRDALSCRGNPHVPVRIVSRAPSRFAVAGTVWVEADRAPSQVRTEVEAALLKRFSFASRQLGQGVALSEVIAVIQDVPGVAFVDVTGFDKTSLSGQEIVVETIRGHLAAIKPADGVDASTATPAELLILAKAPLDHLEVKPL